MPTANYVMIDGVPYGKKHPKALEWEKRLADKIWCPGTVKNSPAKRIRQSSKPLMNKLESSFLDWLKLDIPPQRIAVQSLRFKLGNGIWYKPDFIVFEFPGQLTAYECKGPHAYRGGFENLKVAAGLYPAVRWMLAWKENGEWKQQHVLP